MTGPGVRAHTPTDVQIGDYTISAIEIAPVKIAVKCAVTGPANTTADVSVTAYFFDSDTATTPYAYAYATYRVGPSPPHQVFELDNASTLVSAQPPVRVLFDLVAARPTV